MPKTVSIHTLHELEAIAPNKDGVRFIKWLLFPFIRFTNWKQEALSASQKALIEELFVSIHTLHELEARKLQLIEVEPVAPVFPFIRFTNWKQAFLGGNRQAMNELLFPFIRFTNWKQVWVRFNGLNIADKFPFIRFTNWKQDQLSATLSDLEETFPFIRFTNWKQD